jgi:methylenetetrahydrofolate dehydrogenase (NADP+)/methenyltetrahydrofolate cyclohydrolase
VTERASIIDGTALAAQMVADLALEVTAFIRQSGVTPGLALVALADDPVERLYVRKKVVQCERAGIRAIERPLAAGITTAGLRDELGELSRDPSVHGIFLQWPLPKTVDIDAAVECIAPAKDIDGMRDGTFVPAAACASFALVQWSLGALAGRGAVIAAARDDIFARQIARILRGAGCTVKVAYRGDGGLGAACRGAEILVAALAAPEVVRADWVRPGATVIDVGMHVVAGPDGRRRFVGDVQYEEVSRVARAVTPVPGGVGPVTIACLLKNTLAAARQRRAAEPG